jgi:hypothetical protein
LKLEVGVTFGSKSTNWKLFESGYYRLDSGVLLHSPAMKDGTRSDSVVEVDFHRIDDVVSCEAIGQELVQG